MKLPFFSAALFLATASLSSAIELKSDDTLVWVGNTFVERTQSYGHLETAVSLAAGPKVTGLKFRNLGWSGDSITNESRSYFGPPKEGQERLAKGIAELKPNILFLTYGTVEAMDGSTDAEVKTFEEGLNRIVGDLKKAAGPQLREIVLITPPPLENLGGLLPDQTKNNQSLATYRDAIKRVANSNGATFADLFSTMGGDRFDGKVTEQPLTENGVHYTEKGYAAVAGQLLKALGLSPLKNQQAALEKIEQLRVATIEKNRLFFHRWRPANETYLFLFRKHEQGQNAKEIPMFDPIIAEREKTIDELRAAVFEKSALQ